jgi:hypothetical protein
MASVVARFGEAYLKRHLSSMPQAHRDAMNAMLACRTPALGGHLLECVRCKTRDFAYHSCRHRACPKCLGQVTLEWLEARRDEILPVPYFHVVFTVPEQLRRIIRKHQRRLYPVLLDVAGRTLMEVAKTELGGTIGAMLVLHTWTRTLEYHPHVHCLVPAGYIDADGQWHEVDRPWLAHHRILAEVFKAKLAKGFRKAVKSLQLSGTIFRAKWVVHVDKPRHGTDVVLKYLARYVHRVALSDHRILAVTDKDVVFKYRDKERKDWRVMTLRGHEFLRRFLQHVLPKHLHKVRYFGFWSRGKRPQLRALRQTLLKQKGLQDQQPATKPGVGVDDIPHWLRCPQCNGKRDILGRYDAFQLQQYLKRYGTPQPRPRPPP